MIWRFSNGDWLATIDMFGHGKHVSDDKYDKKASKKKLGGGFRNYFSGKGKK